jgi:uncharacterized ferritin-like protein (DUF455 family)
METKEKFEKGQDVYVACFNRNDNEFYYITAKVMDITYGDEITYVCKAYAGEKLYNVSEKDVFATYQEAEEYCKKYTIMKIKTKPPKFELSDLEKLKVAYEVIRDLETRDDIRASIKNNITVVKNILANDIAFNVTFGEE